MPHSLLTKLVYGELSVTMHLRQLANEIKILRMQKMEDQSSGHYNPARVTTESYLSCTAITFLKINWNVWALLPFIILVLPSATLSQ